MTSDDPSEGGTADSPGWRLFRGDHVAHEPPFPPAPGWRRFGAEADRPAERYVGTAEHADVINAAIHLRRPLLVTGNPGTGKTSLARVIAHELSLGPVLRWSVNSRSTLQDALYRYDAVGRLRESHLARELGGDEAGIGTFVRLGPLGTALVPRERPRVLLVDELDKGDADLPNDLLTVFEDGTFEIPELSRLPEDEPRHRVMTADPGGRAEVTRGIVTCTEFPVVVITSNAEREFPAAFLRRCVRLDLPAPDPDRLREVVAAHLGAEAMAGAEDVLRTFLAREAGGLATDQLLNAVYLRGAGLDMSADHLVKSVLHQLGGTG
ncbi:AAA family ATPase [Kitasatospora phosalacinea]|uniref:ATPase AAA n=1 Tax=Kitasatospora phosalacinea TaxID=2065 RepID=A0A9W6PD69_9ACTN|nr:MoxR family ATPase [Kitasatospora phosalacinea]GLW52792.1 ATPase AAA [Kitasatospora phosalacinea]